MTDLLQYEFIQNGLIAGVLISIVAGIIGSLVVVNRMTSVAGAIAHSSYGGIGLAIYFGIPILLGATIFAIVMASIIAVLMLKNKKRIDSSINIIWAVGMAIGIIFVDLTPGYHVDLMSYLFGSIIAVPLNDIWYMLILMSIIVVLVAFFYREFLTLSYDSSFAKLRGINVEFFYLLLLVLISFTVVAAINVVGLILVIALFTIPTYLAEIFSNALFKMMLMSSLFGIGFTTLGLLLSYVYNLNSSSCIILCAIVTLLSVKILIKIKNYNTPRKWSR